MEISTLYRAFTFSETPSWIRIQKEDSLYAKIQAIRCSPWGNTTNIYALFERFLEVVPLDWKNNFDLPLNDLIFFFLKNIIGK